MATTTTMIVGPHLAVTVGADLHQGAAQSAELQQMTIVDPRLVAKMTVDLRLATVEAAAALHGAALQGAGAAHRGAAIAAARRSDRATQGVHHADAVHPSEVAEMKKRS